MVETDRIPLGASGAKTTSPERTEHTMRVIKPSFEFMQEIEGKELLRRLERAGRVCYNERAQNHGGLRRKISGRYCQEGA